MENSRQRVGRMGEEAVCEYLLALGHTILERNWRSGHLEVDIISMAADGVHFTEVKSRVAPAAADPSENVLGAKQRNIAKAAQKYMQKLQLEDSEIWLDVASVVFDHGKTLIDYMPGAYFPMYY